METTILNSSIAAGCAALGAVALRNSTLSQAGRVTLCAFSALSALSVGALFAWGKGSESNAKASEGILKVITTVALSAIALSPLLFIVSNESGWKAIAFSSIPTAVYFGEATVLSILSPAV